MEHFYISVIIKNLEEEEIVEECAIMVEERVAEIVMLVS